MRLYLAKKEQTKKLKLVSEAIKTIEKISVSELKNLKAQYEHTTEFVNELNTSLVQLAFVLEKSSYPKGFSKKAKEVMVVMTGNKGLVGSLYQEILDLASKNTVGKSVLAVGLKAESIRADKILSLPFPEGEVLSSQALDETLKKLLPMVNSGQIKKVDVCYPSFGGFVSQQATLLNIYPVDFRKMKTFLTTDLDIPNMLISEPGEKIILEEATKLYLKSFIVKIFCETKLAVIAARLINSQKASDKAQELITKSTHAYLKERRREITNQQLENFIGHINLE